MIAVVQRVTEASVVVTGTTVGAIGPGMLVLVAVEIGDGDEQIAWITQKVLGLRIFRNEGKHFDLDVTQVSGSVLLVSNFTVSADTRKGRRPSLDAAASPPVAEATFAKLLASFRAAGVPTQTGIFGGDMKVSLTNDGPATFIVRTEK